MKYSLRAIFRRLGPGFITGSSDNDPSGIATYSQAGALFGLSVLWTALGTLPFMIAIQEMSARIGMVVGDGVANVLRAHYSKMVLWSFVSLLLIANTINIGADLGAMADAATLLLPGIPFWTFAIAFTALILVLEIFVTYKAYANVLKWFALTLLSYVLTAFLIHADWKTLVVHAFVPTIMWNREFLMTIVAIFGTTISPYLFLWQSHQEIEEEIAEGRSTKKMRKGATLAELKTMRTDTVIGMTFSQIVTFCILSTAAMVFFRNGLHDIQTTSDAARALEPLAGNYAKLLFSFGIIGTGLLAIPVLSASASYALANACNWKEGLYRPFNKARGFYGIIIISTLVGLLMNVLGINPIKALVWAAVLNGLITPPITAIMLAVANNKKIMGAQVNGVLSNVFCGSTLVLMTVAAVLLFIL